MRRTPIRMHRGMCNDRNDPQDLDFSLTFPNSFLGRSRRLALGANGNPLPPPDQRAQIMRPLEFLKAAAWFAALHSPGMKRHRVEPPPPLGHMLTEFSPSFSCTSACHVRLRGDRMPSTGHRACRCARDVQDDGALGCVDNGACDAWSREESAG